MEQPIIVTSEIKQDRKDLVFSVMLHLYCREFKNWTPYLGLPKYDPILRQALKDSKSNLHLRIDFSSQEKEVYVPLVYFSETGNHVFKTKLIQRNRFNDEVQELDESSFLKLAFKEARESYPKWKTIDIESRIEAVIAMLEKRAKENMMVKNRFLDVLSNQFPSSPGIYLKKYLDDFNLSENLQMQLEDLFEMVSILGEKGLIEEYLSLRYIYNHFNKNEEKFKSILNERNIQVKGILFSLFGDYDRSVQNVLHYAFFSPDILLPDRKEEVFNKYFEQEKVQISFRSFDIEQDLELVHEWFHRDHAKAIWKMDWSLNELELFYRTLLPGKFSHSYIGEINGEPAFNFEVYWATRDILGDYYEILPSDYGTHLFIASTDKTKKFPALITRSIVEWMFTKPEINRLVGEGSVDSIAALMNKVHVGFKLQHIIEMPHKKAYLNFCIREWYWAKFPESKELMEKE
jgi:hypothetical protein